MNIRRFKVIIFMFTILLVFFDIYGIKSFVRDIKYRLCHKEVTITTEELEEMVDRNKKQFLVEDEVLRQKLQPNYYSACSEEEKLKILSLVMDKEAKYLGITVPTIKMIYLDDNIGGYYDSDTHHIILNRQYIGQIKGSISTVLHEIFHAYQNECIREVDTQSNLLWAREIAQWKEESENVSNDLYSDEGLVDYYTTDSEESARKYALERMEIYTDFIEYKDVE